MFNLIDKKMQFFKYQATGNDFVMIDNRNLSFPKSKELIEKLCNRRFGIGADGLILLEIQNELPYMVYYNSDGNESTMCGNGGRCFSLFLHHLTGINQQIQFNAIDGFHEASLEQIETNWGKVKLKMIDVNEIQQRDAAYITFTGSPHYVTQVEDVQNLNVFEEGRKVRYSDPFKEKGINVNFISQSKPYYIRTYERGVEDETFSCGTGVTAAAVSVYTHEQLRGKQHLQFHSLGGLLEVELAKTGNIFHDVYLIGNATKVFEGVWM
jgi:diaminopimelate epimerase